MSHLAETASMNVRHTQQRRVAALLDEIAARRQRLYVLKAYGARPAGLRTLKAELTAVRDELAGVTNPATTPRTQPSEPAHAGPVARHPSPSTSPRHIASTHGFGVGLNMREPANLGPRRRSSAGRALHS